MKSKTTAQPLPLPEVEWAFHKVPADQTCACAFWELARLRGEAQEPWLKLPEIRRSELASRRAPWFKELPLTREVFIGALLKNDPVLAAQQPTRCFIFLVDLGARDHALKLAFAQWLDSHPERKAWQARNPNRPPNRRPWRKWLLDIAIYRVHKAGFCRKDGLERLWPLLMAWNVVKPNGRASAAHWNHALKRAEQLRSLRR